MRHAAAPPDQGQSTWQNPSIDLVLQKARNARQPFV